MTESQSDLRNIACGQDRLAAKYSPLWQVVLGTTAGMLIANMPVVLLGSRFADRLPLTAARRAAALLFLILAAWVGWRGLGG
ncbi:MAG: TMEM165/GDT1 family protein [Luteimonas sp.]